MSEEWPSRTRALMAPTWMMRAKTCASGRNSRVEAPSTSKSRCISSTETPSSCMKLPWLSSHPFGRPVVPDV